MSRHVIRQVGERSAAFRLDHPDHRDADRHQRRLSVAGQDQLILRPLEHQPRQRLAERAVDRRENLARLGETIGQVTSHADALTALPRTYKRASRSRPIHPHASLCLNYSGQMKAGPEACQAPPPARTATRAPAGRWRGRETCRFPAIPLAPQEEKRIVPRLWRPRRRVRHNSLPAEPAVDRLRGGNL